MTKKQLYYLLISTIMHQSQDTKKTIENSLDLVNVFEKRNYVLDQADLEYLFKSKTVTHRFPNKMAEYLNSMIDTIRYEFDNNIYNVFNEENINQIEKNLNKFRGIGRHKSKLCILKFLYIKEGSFSLDIYDQVINNCYSFDETIMDELKILKRMGDDE